MATHHHRMSGSPAAPIINLRSDILDGMQRCWEHILRDADAQGPGRPEDRRRTYQLPRHVCTGAPAEPHRTGPRGNRAPTGCMCDRPQRWPDNPQIWPKTGQGDAGPAHVCTARSGACQQPHRGGHAFCGRQPQHTHAGMQPAMACGGAAYCAMMWRLRGASICR